MKSTRKRFLKEAERASSLSDRHIAAVYDVLEENGETFLVMEYVEGQTLRQHLKKPGRRQGILVYCCPMWRRTVGCTQKGHRPWRY